ncbi:response regulator transcription factor, partial [Akkermansia muciniphila]|uniref:response regulator transcription factor n=1 Tax=Akkermansia muciniphila TaxID=239935 RepID=UPI00122F895B
MEHILIVDDEAAIRELLKDYFELEGYRVSTAENGQAALKKVEAGPDLILLDINMPGLDGLSVCRRIRQFVSCPILFLTARVEDADKLIGFGAGGDDYIVKPFNLDILGAQVAAHLRRESRVHTKAKAHFSGELVLDYAARAAYYKGTPLPLAKKEFDIVELLSLSAGQV